MLTQFKLLIHPGSPQKKVVHKICVYLKMPLNLSLSLLEDLVVLEENKVTRVFLKNIIQSLLGSIFVALDVKHLYQCPC